MKIIVCVNSKFYIGNKGELMWKSKSDLAHFKKLTMGGILIIGATTFEKDLKGKTLPGREMVVVGKKYNTLWGAVNRAIDLRNANDGIEMKTIWVIGGASIYEQLLPLCTEVHMSVMDDEQVGDRKFPSLQNYKGELIRYNFKPDVVSMEPESQAG